MREVRFRARRIDNGQWVYGLYIKTPLTDENSGTDPKVGWFFLTGETRYCIANENGAVFVIDPKTLGQHTGLKDKNSKDIFEGDILACRFMIDYDVFRPIENVAVVFEDGRFKPMTDQKMTQYRMLSYYYDYEIIGNIHENPELLTKNEDR